MSAQRSIVIGGGAFAGLALALALRQGLGAEVAVIVADPALAVRPSRDTRATAIVAACRRLFGALGVWGDIASTAQPILDMVVTDSKLEDAMRPVFLTFAGHVEPGEPFAHMVENRYLIDAMGFRAPRRLRPMTPIPTVSMCGSPTAAPLPQVFLSPLTARAPDCASVRAFRRTAGSMISPALSSRSAMSVTIMAVPRSISCPRGRLRSCRSPETAPRWCGRRSAAKPRGSSRL